METLKIVDSRTEKEYTIPIHDGHIRAEDISQIKEKPDDKTSPGIFILDEGYEHTACMKSSVTSIDGQLGTLSYRDIPIDRLFSEKRYEDVMHLVLWGQMPTQHEKDAFRASFSAAAQPPKVVLDVIRSFPRKTETFPMIMAGLSAFIASDELLTKARHQPKPVFHGKLDVADVAITRSIAYFTTIIALIHCHKTGRKFTPPEPGRSLIGNLLLMMGIRDPKVEECFDKLWILYADHEMTNSTAAFLHAASTLTDPMSATLAGMVSGYGPLHGGAIDLAYEAFRQIGSPENVPIYIEMCKSKRARLFGYGHRVYKTRDPRLSLIEELMYTYREDIEANPILRVAVAIDSYANKDPYFVERGLKANADLFGCFLYTAMGIDEDMITAIIILSRAAGVLAHWRESLTQPVKLWRPRQVYKGTMPN
ncbi:citrate synthase [Truncatella angustata]|uniref:Citrate synthase n=1 Tax=Truncatella angustata TaxID=152316 RepID=A0A9P8UEN6_9PEZI|nr:citrate synthase [Truncatella angustata]KAH6648539.1 citrate synthase [Truncatella angustata]KAH8198459.1 hypothetical protein TruAng_007391 [Truncatella angustata]